MLARREEHARALNAEGLRVTGRADLHGAITAATDPADLPDPDLVLVCCKGTDLDAIGAALAGHFAGADGDDHAERPRRRRDRRAPRRLAAAHLGHVHERHPPLGHERRVHPRHRHLDRPEPRHDRRGCPGGRRADPLRRPEGRGLRRPPPDAVVEADLQRDRQRGRRAHRPPARAAVRAARRAGRPRPPRARPDGRGQGGRRRSRGRARRGSLGDERPRDPSAAPGTIPRCSRTSRPTGRPRST